MLFDETFLCGSFKQHLSLMCETYKCWYIKVYVKVLVLNVNIKRESIAILRWMLCKHFTVLYYTIQMLCKHCNFIQRNVCKGRSNIMFQWTFRCKASLAPYRPDFPAVFFHIFNFDICQEIQLTNTNIKGWK